MRVPAVRVGRCWAHRSAAAVMVRCPRMRVVPGDLIPDPDPVPAPAARSRRRRGDPSTTPAAGHTLSPTRTFPGIPLPCRRDMPAGAAVTLSHALAWFASALRSAQARRAGVSAAPVVAGVTVDTSPHLPATGQPAAASVVARDAAIAANWSRAACRSSTMSAAISSGAGRLSASSSESSRSQKMSRDALSLATSSS